MSEQRTDPAIEALKRELDELKEEGAAKGRLFDLLGLLTAQKSVDDICRTLVEGVRQFLGFERAGLFLWHVESREFRGTFGTDLQGNTKDEHRLVMDYFPGGPEERILHGSSIERGCKLGEPVAQPGEEGVKADLIGLRVGDRLYGILSVDNRISRRPISERELEHLKLLSKVFGNAIDMARAQAALEQSEQRFRQVTDSSGEWIWELDAENRYVYSSPVVRDILGLEPAAIAGHPFADYVIEEDQEAVMLQLHEAKHQKRPFRQLIHRQVHSSGRRVLLDTTGIPIVGDRGQFCGFRGASRDVTRESELESQLRHSQKMDVVGRLAGGIAHDFNNILTSILGYSNLILEEIPQDSPLRGDVGQIKTAGERAASLTRQLLAFSRRQVMHKEKVQLNEIVHDMEKLLLRTLGEEYHITTELAEDLCAVEADADRIQQIVLHLVINARDAMSDAALRKRAGGQEVWDEDRVKRLTIQTVKTELREPLFLPHAMIPPGSYAVLHVTDTGVGMTKEVQAHLFEPFFTTKDVGEGSGLGLSTVYGLIHQMGGTIGVESTEGKGTTFRVYFPAMIELPPENIGSPDHEPLQGTGTILVVEDELDVRRLTVRILQSLGYRLLDAANGAEALTACLQYRKPIDLVITDMVMPQMGGKQFIEALRKVRRDFKVLLVTGYSSDDTVDGAAIGTDIPIIQKPFTPETLARKVKEVLKK